MKRKNNMIKPIVSIIAAHAENMEIGKGNKLLWHIPDDLKRFKTLTSGHPIIMGRKTYESIGKPLPNRTNILVTRDRNYTVKGCIVTHSLEEAIEKASDIDQQEIFIIGGGELYQQGMALADKLYITLVKGTFEADTFFPSYSQFTKVIAKEEKKENGYEYIFLELSKV
jgi:dihydrofolate reductase